MICADAAPRHVATSAGQIGGGEDVQVFHAEPVPKPGWHDLFALCKRGAMRIEGGLHPFMANLQYFKDLVALPREQGPR